MSRFTTIVAYKLYPSIKELDAALLNTTGAGVLAQKHGITITYKSSTSLIQSRVENRRPLLIRDDTSIHCREYMTNAVVDISKKTLDIMNLGGFRYTGTRRQARNIYGYVMAVKARYYKESSVHDKSINLLISELFTNFNFRKRLAKQKRRFIERQIEQRLRVHSREVLSAYIERETKKWRKMTPYRTVFFKGQTLYMYGHPLHPHAISFIFFMKKYMGDWLSDFEAVKNYRKTLVPELLKQVERGSDADSELMNNIFYFAFLEFQNSERETYITRGTRAFKEALPVPSALKKVSHYLSPYATNRVVGTFNGSASFASSVFNLHSRNSPSKLLTMNLYNYLYHPYEKEVNAWLDHPSILRKTYLRNIYARFSRWRLRKRILSRVELTPDDVQQMKQVVIDLLK